MTARYACMAAVVAVVLSAATPLRAEPGGCLKYGAAGAVGGHIANHHAVLGAGTGCLLGMYKRHEFRKEARAKAKLYDQEHPGAKGSYEEKATAYDVEHSAPPSGAPSGQGNPGAPHQAPQGGGVPL